MSAQRVLADAWELLSFHRAHDPREWDRWVIERSGERLSVLGRQ
jgi:hypothetical protein